MNAASRHAILTALSLILGIALVWWVQPETTPGTIFLVAVTVIVVNAVGVIFWRTPPAKRKPRKLHLLPAGILFTAALSLVACVPSAPAPAPPPPAAPMPTAAPLRGNGGPSGSGLNVAELAPAINTGSALAGGAAPLTASRNFLKPSDIPPAGFGAYGMVAFTALPTDDEGRQRLARICKSFLASLPSTGSLPASVAHRDQMVTIWPLDDPRNPAAQAGDCDYLIGNYALYAGQSAINDTRDRKHKLDGRGPFLIGWSPSNTRGVKDAVVLVIDLSAYDTQDSFDAEFRLWEREIVENPTLWRNGFSVENLRLAVREFADRYGQSILDGMKFWGKSGKAA
jgi:hypothetical protein